MKVSAVGKTKDESGTVTGENSGEVDFNFGENLKEAVKLYGEDVVMNSYRQASTVALQSNMRRHLSAGTTGKELNEALKDWKPGQVQRSKKSPADKILALMKGRSPEEVAEILAAAGLG